jgi:hypothetical protein
MGSIVISAGVTSIGDSVFNSTPYLTNIIVAPENPALAVENGALINSAQKTLVRYFGASSGSFSVPSTVTSITAGAFQNTGLSVITIPNTVTNIGDEAFEYSWNLKSIVLPDSIQQIGFNTFLGSTLTYAVLPSGLKNIPDGAFEG